MAATQDLRYRPMGRWTFLGGIAATLLVHALVGFAVWIGQVKHEPRPEATRDLMVTKMVTFGKPREKFWLPRIVEPPKPKAPPEVIKVATDPTTAQPAPKEAPKPQDPEISKDLKRALERAKALAANAVPEEAEGSLTGSTQGTSSEAAEGDAYATAVHAAIRKNWVAPTSLVDDAQLASLVTEVRVAIGEDGTLLGPKIVRPSGNQFFDDSCLQAIKATGQVPPPPPAVRQKFRRGLVVEFSGKELAR